MSVTPETTDLLGEQIDLNTGSLSFSQTDISIPGNNHLSVSISRVNKGKNYTWYNTLDMGDWMLDIPYIHTTLLKNPDRYSGDWGQGRECSGDLNPGPIYDYGSTFNENEFWNGDTLNVPGRVNEKLLHNSGAITSQISYPKITKSNWRISCASNPDSFGEKFIAQAPNGDIYTFSELRLVVSQPIIKGFKATSRYNAYMFVSSIKDVHGNTVTYDYDANSKLTKIHSSDFREINIEYNADNKVDKISTGNRVWTYGYSGSNSATLSTVTRPDGLAWQYNLGAFATSTAKTAAEDGYDSCLPALGSSTTGSVTHPNGTTGNFTLTPKNFGRSRVKRSVNTNKGIDYTKKCFVAMSLTNKTLTGTGLSNMSWAYDYSQNEGYWDTVSPASKHKYSGSIPTTLNNYDYRTTKVSSPDGSKTIYYHNRNFQSVLDGKLVATEYFDKNGTTLLKRVRNKYSQSAFIGDSEQFNENTIPHSYVARKSSSIEEVFKSGGTDTYTTNYSNFNTYHAPQTIIEYGNAGGRTTSSSYYHNTSKWILNVPDNKIIGSDLNTARNHNSFGQVTRVTHNGVQHNYTFSGALLASYKDPESNTTFLSNYYRGIPRTVTFANGTTKKSIVNSHGEVTEATNQNGTTTEYGRDSLGRVNYVWQPMGNDISLSYSKNSYSKTQGGYKETHSLDSLNRTILSTYSDNTNNITRYKNTEYDAYNRTIFSSIISTSPIEETGNNSAYDGLGRTISSSSPMGSSSFVYRNQNRVNVTDGRYDTNGQEYVTTNYSTAYGSSSNSFSIRTDVPSSSGTIVTTLNKNTVGKLLSVSQGGKTINYGYHPTYKDYVTSESHPSFTIYTGVDKNGNTISKRVGASATTYYNYNEVNQLTNTNYPIGTSDINYTYRNTGELLTAKNGVGDITYSYNDLGKMTYRSTKVDGVTYGFSYAYDYNSNLISITYPNETVNYNPNLFGEARQVGSYASNVIYEPTGAIKSLTYGNGLSYKGIVDSSKLRLGTIEVKYGSSTKIKKVYTFDANSNVSSITDGVKSNYSVSNFQYDGAERLTSAYSGAWNGTTSFTYDLLGNIKSKIQAGATSTYNYGSTNLLSSISGSKNYTFSYDAYGNVTYNGHNYFTYNDAGQLASASGGGTSKSFSYDALGNRVKAITNGNVEIEIFNDANQLMWLKDSTGVSTQKVYVGSRIVAQKRGTTKRFLHFDALGSVIATSDSSRNITYEHYRPFGEKVANPTGTNNDQWYAAKQFDDELDIVYMQARYYDPVIGRFYSNDPLGFRDVHSFNRYAYANNNPYKYTDPTGQASESSFLNRPMGVSVADNLATTAEAGGNAIALADTASDFAMPIKGIVKQGIKQAIKQVLKKACCFVAGTQVLTESGYKSIEDIKLGEKLWAKNVETGEQAWKPITKIFNEPDRGIYEIQLVGSDSFKQKIEATDDHPFYVVGKGWKKTIELNVGDEIETDGNGSMKVISVIDQERQAFTYNFTVADFHTYYVTKKNVLVHNCNLKMKSGGLGESTSGSFDSVKDTVNQIANSGDAAAKACATCKLKTSLKTRRADQKRQTNKNTKTYQEHKNRINMEQKGLDKLERG